MERSWSPTTSGQRFGEQPPSSYYLAHWWPRVGASLLDGLILTPAYVVVVVGLHLFTTHHEVNAVGQSVTRWQANDVWVVPLVYLLYAIVLLCRNGEHNGQTFGKQALRLRVIRNDGQPVTITTVLLREGLVRTIPSILGGIFGLVAVIDILWPLWDAENRAIHDFVGKTHLVQTASAPAVAADSWKSPPPADPSAGDAAIVRF
jgi:uncharacterized RDD family membrane protein YckC